MPFFLAFTAIFQEYAPVFLKIKKPERINLTRFFKNNREIKQWKIN